MKKSLALATAVTVAAAGGTFASPLRFSAGVAKAIIIHITGVAVTLANSIWTITKGNKIVYQGDLAGMVMVAGLDRGLTLVSTTGVDVRLPIGSHDCRREEMVFQVVNNDGANAIVCYVEVEYDETIDNVAIGYHQIMQNQVSLTNVKAILGQLANATTSGDSVIINVRGEQTTRLIWTMSALYNARRYEQSTTYFLAWECEGGSAQIVNLTYTGSGAPVWTVMEQLS